MKILLHTGAEPAEFAFAQELCRGLEKDGVDFVVAVTNGPLEPHQRAALHGLGNVTFVESTYRPDFSASNDAETIRTIDWLHDLAREFDVDIVHADRPALAASHWDRPVAAPKRWIPVGRSHGSFSPRSKEMLIAATDVHSVAGIAASLSWPVFVLANAPAPDEFPSLTNLHFLGQLSNEDAAAVLGRASIFVHTRCDAGYSTLDAALCGCALVLYETPESLAQWQGAAAFVSEARDDHTLRALQWLVQDANARADFGQRARAMALNYTAERMASSYLSLYIASLTTGRPVATHSS